MKSSRKKVTYLLALCLLFSMTLTACGTTETKKEEAITSLDKETTLVVYFSMPETQTPDDMSEEEANSTVVIDGKVYGNTEYVATLIQQQTGADLFRIEPSVPYPTNHQTLIDQAKEEQAQIARPELLSSIENFDQYQTVFLGYPNWWGDMPMIVYSFLDTYDFTGKTIIPFNTHGGSGFSDTIETIASLEPTARILENGYSVSRNDVEGAKEEIIAWIKGLNKEL